MDARLDRALPDRFVDLDWEAARAAPEETAQAALAEAGVRLRAGATAPSPPRLSAQPEPDLLAPGFAHAHGERLAPLMGALGPHAAS